MRLSQPVASIHLVSRVYGLFYFKLNSKIKKPLSLSPKTAEPQVKNILFVVDPKTFDVRESVITDGQGNLNDLTFADIKTNTRLPDSQFHFAPPPGVRVIDTAKLGK